MPELVLKSESQIQSSILQTFIAEAGINDVNAGSVADVITQAVAQEDFKQYYNIALVSRLSDLDSQTGDDLDDEAFGVGLERFAEQKASGYVTIQREEGFTKVSTSFFVGEPAPIAGNTTIKVDDASNAAYSTSGTLILGRGTTNEETVTYSVAPVNNTSHWTFTLDAPLVNNHSVEETVILSQGSNQTITAGTVVLIPATGISEEIQYSTDNDVVLLAGEAEITDVAITALVAGSSGNAPVSSIEAFKSEPFVGARVYNPRKLTNGTDEETDDQLRDRIKSVGDTLTKGVENAILKAVVGLVEPETAKRVVSATVILPVGEEGDVKVYIDDGTGFEPSFASQGYEIVRENATGGEVRLQTDFFPVTKALLESGTASPFNFSTSGLTLDVTVGILEETLTFNTTDFVDPSNATALEVVTVINNSSALLEARTSENETKVVITAKEDTQEDLEVTGGTANAILAFPTDTKKTLNLYKNDVPLSKDGSTATLDSPNTAPFDLAAIGAFPHTLTVIVDEKTANTLTASFSALDAANTSAVTPQEIVDVLNRDLPGVVASVSNDGARVRIQSCTSLSSDSKLRVTGGTLNDATDGLNYPTTVTSGSDTDYLFNRELGIIELATPLVAGDTITAGSIYTRGYLRAALAENYTIGSGDTLIVSVDGGANQTITFDGSFTGGGTAGAVATFINNNSDGLLAISRSINGINYLEISTTTYATTGSIEVKSTGTANASFNFTEDTVVSSITADKSFVTSQTAEPFDFVQDDNLVVVVDEDTINSAYDVEMSYPTTLTGVTSTTVFADSNINSVFDEADELVDFYLIATSGTNTTTETITTVSNVSGSTWRYTFSGVPANFANFNVGDVLVADSLDDAGNNGAFLITAKGASDVDVTNLTGVAAAAQSGGALLGERNQVTAYNQVSGEYTVGAAFSILPVIGDEFAIVPSTINNLIAFFGNVAITSLPTKAAIEGAANNTKLQFSSLQNGSDGQIQVSGGSANSLLNFDTSVVFGKPGYDYWTGLTALVHKTIYGDDSDAVEFEGFGAAGITFRILAPLVVKFPLSLKVTTEDGVTLSSKINEIKSKVTGYINNLGVGGDVIMEQIRCEVVRIIGVSDVQITNFTDNIPIADNQIARINSSDIKVG